MSFIAQVSLTKAWVTLGQHLSLRFTNQNSTAACCPFCRKGIITFYNDPLTCGRRFATGCCGRAGDHVQLAADIKCLSRDEAMRFIAHQIPDLQSGWLATAERRDAYESRWAELDAVWRQATVVTDAVNCDSFINFVNKLSLHFTHLYEWHQRNLNQQYRWLTASRYKALISGPTRRSVVRSDWPSGADGVLVSRLYGTPGCPTGLLFQYVDRVGKYFEQSLLADRESSDCGLAIHPEVAIRQLPLIICRDAAWQLRATFHQAHHGGSLLNGYATMFDSPERRSESIQSLRNRQVIFWAERHSSQQLRAAMRLNAPMSSFGVVNGEFKTRVLKDLDPQNPHRSLLRRSVTWESWVGEKSRQTTPHELLDLINGADLSSNELSRVRECVDPGLKPLLQGGTDANCPPAQHYTRSGVIEQSPAGWTLSQRGTRELICDRPWRVAREVLRGPDAEPACLLEFYHAGRWIGHEVSQAALHKKPLDTLLDACLAIRIRPVSIAPEWVKRAVMIACSLNPPSDPQVIRPVGLDAGNGMLRTSLLEISILDGTTTRRHAGGEHKLLPLADGEPPARKAIQHLEQNPHAQRILSALTLQLLHLACGRRDLAILTSGQSSLLADRILKQAGLRDVGSVLPFEVLHLNQPLTNYRTIRQAQMAKALWAAASSNVAHWLAASRPTVLLSRKHDPFQFELDDLQVQRLIASLLSGSLRAVHDGQPFAGAIMTGWADLFGSIATPPESANRRVVPISRRRALGYWVSKGLTSGMLSVSCSKPKQVTSSSCWRDHHDPAWCWVAKPSIQGILQAYHYTPWDFTELLGGRTGDPLSCNLKTMNQVVTIKLPMEALTEPARRVIESSARRRTTTQKQTKTGTDDK